MRGLIGKSLGAGNLYRERAREGERERCAAFGGDLFAFCGYGQR